VFTLMPLLSGEGRAHHGEILSEATKLAEAGLLVPRVDPAEFPLSATGAAHEAMTSRKASGKVVVTVKSH
jgi:NADPH:quinone reductase-like Zn-dependent oxidoreductase